LYLKGGDKGNSGSDKRGALLMTDLAYGGLVTALNTTAESSYSTTVWNKIVSWNLGTSTPYMTASTSTKDVTVAIAGKYLVLLTFTWIANDASSVGKLLQVSSMVNGSQVGGLYMTSRAPAGTFSLQQSCTAFGIMTLAAADAFSICQKIESGLTSLTIQNASMQMFRIAD
jgi:hypothetical protein